MNKHEKLQEYLKNLFLDTGYSIYLIHMGGRKWGIHSGRYYFNPTSGIFKTGTLDFLRGYIEGLHLEENKHI